MWGFTCVLLFSCSVSNSMQPHGLQHARLPCPPPTPRACSNDWLYAQTSLDLELQRLHLLRPASSGKYLSHYLLTLKSQDSFHLVWLTLTQSLWSENPNRLLVGGNESELSNTAQIRNAKKEKKRNPADSQLFFSFSQACGGRGEMWWSSSLTKKCSKYFFQKTEAAL